MSITLTVRPAGADSGGTEQTIAGDGAIDTREEAEAALAFLPEGSSDTIAVGKETMTRADLIGIRDGAKPGEKKEGEDKANTGEGVSHGVVVKGEGAAGLGDSGHAGGGFDLDYVAGIPLLLGDTRLFLDPTLGFRLNHGSKDYELPGGEAANSSFTSAGANLGADLRLVPPILNHRFWTALGVRLGVGGFFTPDSDQVSLPPAGCAPGDFGRAECEPTAGPRTGNAGTSGLKNPRTGSSRGVSGVALNADFPVTIGADAVVGDWGSLGIFGQFIPGVTGLLPGDGDGLSYWHVGGGGGLVARFGGAAAETPAPEEKTGDKDGDGVPDEKDRCVAEPGAKDTDGCPKLEGASVSGTVSAQATDAAGQQFVVKLAPPQDGEITKAQIRGADGKTYAVDVDPSKLQQTGEVLVTPKEKLPAGKYVLRLELLGDDGRERIGLIPFEVKDIKALEVTITPDAANAPVEKTASELSFGVVTNKALTIAPRFILQGQTAGLQKNYYPDPKTYEVDASQIGQATSFSFKTPDTLPAGTYTVVFDVKADDGTIKRVSTTMTVGAKPKTVEVASVRKTGSSPYIGDRLSVWVTMEREAPEDTAVDVVVGNARASGIVKKGQKESEEIKVWGPGQARSASGGGELVIQATPKGGKTFNGPSVTVPGGGGGGTPPPKGPRKPAGQ